MILIRFNKSKKGVLFRRLSAEWIDLKLPAVVCAMRPTRGWMTPEEAVFLFASSRESKHGCIVEISNYRGRSTIDLALGARNFGFRHSYRSWRAFLDADVLPNRHRLKLLHAAALVAPNRLVFGSIGFSVTGGYWGLCLWAIVSSGVHPYLPTDEAQGGTSASMLVPRETMHQIGRFVGRFLTDQDTMLSAELREIVLANRLQAQASVGHLVRLGLWSCICCRLKPLRVGLDARCWSFGLGLWIAKLYLICSRVFRWGRVYRITFLGLGPGILLSLLVWNLGFIYGLSKSVTSLAIKRYELRCAGDES